MAPVSRLTPMVAAFAAVSLAAAPALAGTCAMTDELMALNTRVLQSELVVAALNCGQSAQYNAFVKRFEPQLVADGIAFRNYFNRVYGPHGEERMDQLVTKLANYAVERSWAWGASYCAVEDAVFASLMTVDPVELANFASLRPTAGDHQIPPCQVQARTTSAADPAPVPQAAPAASPAPAPAAEPEPLTPASGPAPNGVPVPPPDAVPGMGP